MMVGLRKKEDVDDKVKFYVKYQSELAVEDDLVFFNFRLIVPSSLRQFILSISHESHLGIEEKRTVGQDKQ